MIFKCNAVDEGFLTSASLCFINEVILDATPDVVFTLFEDGNSWSKWFPGIKSVEWTSPKPFGVDTTRTVSLGSMDVHERFFIWEKNQRFTFYFTGTSLPFMKALCEDYVLEPVGENQTRFTYTVACEPIWLVRLGGSLVEKALGKTFSDAAQALQRYLS